MPETAARASTRGDLPAILILAVIQGWVLYALHHSIQSHAWPATQPAWLLALYAVTVFVPLTLQLLVEHLRKTALWIIGSLLFATVFYFGWHHGSSVPTRGAEQFVARMDFFPLAF